MSEISNAPLAGVRVIESSMLGPAAITTHLADLGADVIKVESPSGDYVRVRPFAHAGGGRLKHELPNDGVLPIDIAFVVLQEGTSRSCEWGSRRNNAYKIDERSNVMAETVGERWWWW